MSYTLEQKREARENGSLWWRFPDDGDEYDRSWTRLQYSADVELLQLDSAEYHIGPTAPTPPRVLSGLEGELLEALKELHERMTQSVQLGLTAEEAYDSFYQDVAQSAIQKAEAQQ